MLQLPLLRCAHGGGVGRGVGGVEGQAAFAGADAHFVGDAAHGVPHPNRVGIPGVGIPGLRVAEGGDPYGGNRICGRPGTVAPTTQIASGVGASVLARPCMVVRPCMITPYGLPFHTHGRNVRFACEQQARAWSPG